VPSYQQKPLLLREKEKETDPNQKNSIWHRQGGHAFWHRDVITRVTGLFPFSSHTGMDCTNCSWVAPAGWLAARAEGEGWGASMDKGLLLFYFIVWIMLAFFPFSLFSSFPRVSFFPLGRDSE